MKKLLVFLLAALMLLCVPAYASGGHHAEAEVDAHTSASLAKATPSGEPSAEAEVDAYTSASLTKTTLSGAELDAAAALLAAHCSDLASLAASQEPGYVAPANSTNAQIMTVNPDGCVGLSTISEWKYVPASSGRDQVMMELTEGQNALNLLGENARGTLLVRLDGISYIVHLDVVEYDEQEYDDAAYAAGEFNRHYSGAANGFSEFHITCDVLSIETSSTLFFD